MRNVVVIRDPRQQDFEAGGGNRHDPRRQDILEHDAWLMSLKRTAAQNWNMPWVYAELFLYVPVAMPYKRVLALWRHKPIAAGCWGLFNDLTSFIPEWAPSIDSMRFTLLPSRFHAALALDRMKIEAWESRSDWQSDQDRAMEHNNWLAKQTREHTIALPYAPSDSLTDEELETEERFIYAGKAKRVVGVNQSA